MQKLLTWIDDRFPLAFAKSQLAANSPLPVSGTVAWWVLASLTVGLLILGMVVFSRREYLDV